MYDYIYVCVYIYNMFFGHSVETSLPFSGQIERQRKNSDAARDGFSCLFVRSISPIANTRARKYAGTLLYAP